MAKSKIKKKVGENWLVKLANFPTSVPAIDFEVLIKDQPSAFDVVIKDQPSTFEVSFGANKFLIFDRLIVMVLVTQ